MKSNLSRYMKSISGSKPLSKAEEIECFIHYRKGDRKRKAYNKIYNANLGFVVNVAKNYKNTGIEIDDLIQVGNKALDRSIKEFNHTSGYKFITYAVNWIKQAMLNEIAAQSHFVKITGIENTKKCRMKKTVEFLNKKLNHRQPTYKEIVKEYPKHFKGKLTIHDLNQLEVLDTEVSMESPIKNLSKENLTFGDTISDKKTPSPVDQMSLKEVQEKIVKFLNDANLKSVKDLEGLDIIKMYYGINYETTFSLEEIGEKYNKTRERIRQLKKECMGILKKFNNRMEQTGSFHLTHDMLW